MKIRIKKAPAQNGLSVEGNKYKTLSTDGINLGGDYHGQGGTMVSSNGEMVEAEKNEPIYTGSDGSNYVFGNLSNPVTGTKFKSEGKKLLTEKGKFEKKFDKANQNLSVADPYSKFGSLDFNTAKVQMEAAQIETQALKQELDGLAALQEGILGAAEASGRKPEQISKAMKKNGGKIKVRMGGLPIAKDGEKLNSFWNTLQRVNQIGQFQPVVTPQQQAQQMAPVQQATTPLENLAPNGQGTLAQRNNNPGNLKFIGQSGAVKGDAGFAKFDSYESGYQALLNDLKAKQTGKSRNKSLGPQSTVADLIKVYAPREDNNDPVSYANTVAKTLGITANTPIGGLNTDQLAKAMAQVEDRAYAISRGNTPISPLPQARPPAQQIPQAPVTAEAPYQPIFSPNGPITPLESASPQPLQVPMMQGQPMTQLPYQAPAAQQPARQLAGGPKRNRLNPVNFLGEIAAIVDRPDYVQGQQYDPILMSPIRISLQDQRNQNTGSFNALARTMANNPEALATLQAQKYQQDQNIYGNEFRMNQQSQNQVLNQNNQILNQAQLQNNEYGDIQYQRQAAASAITDTNRMNALNSISAKYQQNNLYNNERQAQFDSQQRLSNMYGNLYENYSFDQTGNVQFNPGQGQNFFANGRMPQMNQQAYYDYEAQQKELKRRAKEEAAKNRTLSAFGHKFNK